MAFKAIPGVRDVQQPDDVDFLPRHPVGLSPAADPFLQSLLLSNYLPAKRSVALALWSMTVIVAPICGPILGGTSAITTTGVGSSSTFRWSGCGSDDAAIPCAVVRLYTEQRRIDSIGLALPILGIGSLQMSRPG